MYSSIYNSHTFLQVYYLAFKVAIIATIFVITCDLCVLRARYREECTPQPRRVEKARLRLRDQAPDHHRACTAGGHSRSQECVPWLFGSSSGVSAVNSEYEQKYK